MVPEVYSERVVAKPKDLFDRFAYEIVGCRCGSNEGDLAIADQFQVAHHSILRAKSLSPPHYAVCFVSYELLSATASKLG